jgi:hypothetical protein
MAPRGRSGRHDNPELTSRSDARAWGAPTVPSHVLVTRVAPLNVSTCPPPGWTWNQPWDPPLG